MDCQKLCHSLLAMQLSVSGDLRRWRQINQWLLSDLALKRLGFPLLINCGGYVHLPEWMVAQSSPCADT